MRLAKFLTLLCLIFFPLLGFAHCVDKAYLVFQVNNKKLVLNSSNIKTAKLNQGEDGHYSLVIKLTPTAQKKMTQMTSGSIGKTATFLFNNKEVFSKATIQSPIGTGTVKIAGLPQDKAQAIIDTVTYKKKCH